METNRLSKTIEAALNAQMTNEAHNAQIYLAYASWADSKGYDGIANFLFRHANEERNHMMKFLEYILKRGGNVVITAIPAPGSGAERAGKRDFGVQPDQLERPPTRLEVMLGLKRRDDRTDFLAVDKKASGRKFENDTIEAETEWRHPIRIEFVADVGHGRAPLVDIHRCFEAIYTTAWRCIQDEGRIL